jgi:hypothetical protein
MDWWILIVSYGFLGSGIKYIDQAYDVGIFSRSKAIFMGAIMGLLMGAVISKDPISAMFFLSFIIFALISRKIDNPAFIVGTIVVFLVPAANLIFDSANYEVNWLILFVLIFSGWIDEEGNDLADRKRINGLLRRFFEYRSFMKIIVFLMAAFSVIPWIYFIAFMTYDLSYLAVSIYSKNILTKHNRKRLR